jgi:AcrR family transcriptional regulator
MEQVKVAYATPKAGLPHAVEGLPKEERILWSMVRVLGEKGTDSPVTVSEVTRRAGVSRPAFYELFENIDECVYAAYERVIDALASHVRRAYEGEGSWPLRLRRGLSALLEAFSAEPEVARMAAVDIPAVEPEARRRYHDALERFVPLFREGRSYARQEGALPPDLERMAVASIEAVVSDEVAAGRTKQLPQLLPDLLFTVLTPYVGPEAASAEVRRTDDD